MIVATIGNVFTLKHTVATAAGAAVDPATVTFTVRPPVGLPVVAGPTRHTGVGSYEFDIEPTMTGDHKAFVQTLGPDSSAATEFYVLPSGVA